MNIKLENLEKIEEIYTLLVLLCDSINNKSNKRWLCTDELSDYISYSKESIKNMIRDGELIIGIHFHKIGKKNLFDKNAIDSWILGTLGDINNNQNNIVEDILKDIA